MVCMQQAPTWTFQAGDGGSVGITWTNATGEELLRTRKCANVQWRESVREVLPEIRAITSATVTLDWPALTYLIKAYSLTKPVFLSLNCALVTPDCWATTSGESINSAHSAALVTVSHGSVINCAACDGNNLRKELSSPILVTEHWSRSWSHCTGSHRTGDFLSDTPGCRYFLPDQWSPSQPICQRTSLPFDQ